MENKFLISLLITFFCLSPFLVLATDIENDEIYQNYTQTKNRATNISNQVADFLSDKNLSLEERVEIITSPNFGQPEENKQAEDNNQESSIISSEQNQNQKRSTQNLVITDRRSEVALAIQEILNNTENREDIGEQVRLIAQNHAKNHENLIAPLNRLQNQNRLIHFIFGPEPQALAQAQQILQDNQTYLAQLENLKNSLDEDNQKLTITEALDHIQEIENELQIVVDNSTRSFSLLGWLINLLSKK